MKKKIIWVVLVIAIIIAGIGIYNYFISNKNDNSDALKFKKEYEELNGLEIENSANKYRRISIPENNPIVYSNYDELMKLLDDGTGIIYFGFPQCPWCRQALPVLLDVAEDMDVEKIYYFNNRADRDTRTLNEDGEIVIEKEGTKEYYDLLKKLGDYASIYEGLNDSSIKRIYFPTVVFVVDGQIKSTVVGTVDSQESPYVDLTEEQLKELKGYYTEGINSTIACDIDSAC